MCKSVTSLAMLRQTVAHRTRQLQDDRYRRGGWCNCRDPDAPQEQVQACAVPLQERVQEARAAAGTRHGQAGFLRAPRSQGPLPLPQIDPRLSLHPGLSCAAVFRPFRWHGSTDEILHPSSTLLMIPIHPARVLMMSTNDCDVSTYVLYLGTWPLALPSQLTARWRQVGV